MLQPMTDSVHIADCLIICDDLETMTDYYVHVLGFKVMTQVDTHTLKMTALEADGVVRVLVQQGGVLPFAASFDEHINVRTMLKVSRRQAAAIFIRLSAHNLRAPEIVRFDHTQVYCRTRDPEGNEVLFSYERSSAPHQNPLAQAC